MTTDTAAEPNQHTGPEPGEPGDRLAARIDRALAAITREWDAAARALDTWPDPRQALAEAGRFADAVRALVDRQQRPLRGRQVKRMAASTGRSIRRLAAEESMSHEAMNKLARAADDDQESV